MYIDVAQRFQGLIDLPELARENAGPQKYPDRKEMLVRLMQYVYDHVRNERELGRLLCPILMDILPVGATVLNKEDLPVSADGIRNWYRRHAKSVPHTSENSGTHNS